LDILLKHNVNKIIFSSSASVYGEPQIVPINEDHPQKPLNAYGETKLMFERILEWYGRAYGLKHLSLRYFNAGGASVALGEDHHPETHLIPNVLQAALDANRSLSIFGSDYPTRDGSCIRDYVHVIDIAQAHLLALEKLEMLSGRVYNLGNGAGSSVMELIAAARKITGNEIQFKIYPRRAGDPAVLTASPELAKAELGWKPRFPQLEAILESAWAWKKNHPNGYEP
jgi:UDP-glucose 4-epimerase